MPDREKLKQFITNNIFKSDDYITKLCYVNAGFLNIGNVWCFDYAVSNLPSENPILEIGSFCGLSSNVITYLKHKHSRKNKLICVDAWDFSSGDNSALLGNHPSLTNGKYSEIVLNRFKENTILFSGYDLPFAFKSTSQDFFSQWSKRPLVQDIFERELKLGGPISFAYIDGNHDYDYVKNDFEAVDQNLETNGFILFDDSAEGSGWQVHDLVIEICKNPRYRLIRNQPNYFFQKIG